jgi:hypothetical protein
MKLTARAKNRQSLKHREPRGRRIEELAITKNQADSSLWPFNSSILEYLNP